VPPVAAVTAQEAGARPPRRDQATAALRPVGRERPRSGWAAATAAARPRRDRGRQDRHRRAVPVDGAGTFPVPASEASEDVATMARASSP